jgi:phosphoribosyl 1,2-cyclic phosphodiesterase
MYIDDLAVNFCDNWRDVVGVAHAAAEMFSEEKQTPESAGPGGETAVEMHPTTYQEAVRTVHSPEQIGKSDLIVEDGQLIAKASLPKANKPATRYYDVKKLPSLLRRFANVLVEQKFDGMDMMLSKEKVWSGRGLDKTSRVPHIIEELKNWPHESFILHGQAMMYSDSQPMHRTLAIGYLNGEAPVEEGRNLRIWIFDIIELDGKSLADMPMIDRLKLLRKEFKGTVHLPIIKPEQFTVVPPSKTAEAAERMGNLKGSEGAMLFDAQSQWNTKRIINFGWCLTGGNFIFTELGLQQLQDVKIGDLVLPKDGLWHQVRHIFTRPMRTTEILHDIKTQKGLKVRLTSTHQVLTKTLEWLSADRCDPLSTAISKPIFDFGKAPCELELNHKGYIKNIEINSDFLRFLGFWVAEGHNDNNGGIYLSQNDAESHVLDTYAEIIQNVIHAEPHIGNYEGKRVLRFWDAPLCRWLIQNFRSRDSHKTVPWWLRNSDFEAFWNGWIEGDGGHDKTRLDNVGTSSCYLAGRAYLIMLSLGKNVSLSLTQPRVGQAHFKLQLLKGGAYSCLKTYNSPVATDGNDLLYDLEIENEDSYSLPNLIVHNSKWKGQKEIDVLVVKKERKQEGWRYLGAIGPINDAQAKTLPANRIAEMKGKKWLIMGHTHVSGVEAAEGDILRVRCLEIVKNNHYDYTYQNAVPMYQPEKTVPDGLDTAEELASQTLQKADDVAGYLHMLVPISPGRPLPTPEEITQFKKASDYIEKRANRQKCMRCEDPPTVDVLYAEGMGRAWFCDKDFEEWKQEPGGPWEKEDPEYDAAYTHEKDICKVYKVTDGEVPVHWKEHSQQHDEKVQKQFASDPDSGSQQFEPGRLDQGIMTTTTKPEPSADSTGPEGSAGITKIKDIDTYDPAKIDDRVLLDDHRICFVPDTPLWANSSFGLMCDSQDKERVMGLDGYEPVEEVFTRHYKGPMISLKIGRMDEFLITPEHPIWVVPLFEEHNHQLGLGSRRWWNAYGGRKREITVNADFVSAENLRRNSHAVIVPIPSTIPTNLPAIFFSLAGWYLAEGFPTSSRCIRFSLGPKEIEYAETIRQLVFSWGINDISIKPLPKEIRVEVHSRELVDLLMTHCGHYARYKTLSRLLLEAEPEKLRLLLDAYEKGDGSRDKNGVTTSSASKALTYALFLIRLKLNKPSSISHRQQKKWSKNFLWELRCSNNPRHDYWQWKNYYCFPIRRVQIIDYDGEVRNLRIASGTYCVPFVVHNCHAWWSTLQSGKPLVHDKPTVKALHDAIAREIEKRGMNHNTPLEKEELTKANGGFTYAPGGVIGVPGMGGGERVPDPADNTFHEITPLQYMRADETSLTSHIFFKGPEGYAKAQQWKAQVENLFESIGISNYKISIDEEADGWVATVRASATDPEKLKERIDTLQKQLWPPWTGHRADPKTGKPLSSERPPVNPTEKQMPPEESTRQGPVTWTPSRGAAADAVELATWNLRFLGTSGEKTFPRKDCDDEQCRTDKRLNASAIFENSGTNVLLDCGSKELAAKVQTRLDAVCVTHAHPDHIDGLEFLSENVPIYMHRSTWRDIREQRPEYAEKLSRRELHFYSSYNAIRIGNVKVRWLPVKHSLKVQTFAIRINGIVLYSPDCLEISDKWLGGVETWIIDGASLTRDIVREQDGEDYGHQSILNSLKQAKKNSVPQVIITHVGHLGVKQEDMPEALSKIALEAEYDKPVLAAHDGFVLPGGLKKAADPLPETKEGYPYPANFYKGPDWLHSKSFTYIIHHHFPYGPKINKEKKIEPGTAGDIKISGSTPGESGGQPPRDAISAPRDPAAAERYVLDQLKSELVKGEEEEEISKGKGGFREHWETRQDTGDAKSLLGWTFLTYPWEKTQRFFSGSIKGMTTAKPAIPKQSTKKFPRGWLDVQGLRKPVILGGEGSAAETNRCGFYEILEEGTFKYGVQRNNLHEYFFYGKLLRGRWIFRLLKLASGSPRWLAFRPPDQQPMDPIKHEDDGHYRLAGETEAPVQSPGEEKKPIEG